MEILYVNALDQNIYTRDVTDRTYEQLQYLASEIIQAGLSVIVDASFLKHQHREQFRQLASKYQAPFIVISCNARESILRERIRHSSLRRAG